MDVKAIQRGLAALSLYRGKVDGDWGPLTRQATLALLLNLRVKGAERWADVRLVVAAQQGLALKAGIEVGEIDGYVGPQTRYALEVYTARAKNRGRPVPDVETWRDREPAIGTASPAADLWPRQAGVREFFGEIGENQTKLSLPYPMRIAWNKRQIVRSTQCHAKVRDAAGQALERTLEHYGLAEIKRLGLDLFGGCFNVRKMRGGSSWSMHSWGIAFDFDPDRNQLKWGRDRAEFAKPDYDTWWRFWEDEGAVSLGRAANYDWMHVQFARL